MTSPRHFAHFLALGLFWGCSPALYKHLADIGVPVSQTILLTGLGVGLVMWLVAVVRGGGLAINSAVLRYGATCAFLMNIPFGINLFLAAHVPPTELAIVITTSPFFNYLIALATGWESSSPRRLMAIIAGFASTIILILTREGTLTGSMSWWLVSSLSIPLLYCVYNNYAARAWPGNADIIRVGAAESLFSGLFLAPVVFLFAPFGSEGTPGLAGYWILIAAIIMWVVERISYFTLINEKGALYTIQATYVSTPAAVIIAAVFFGGGQDQWLWVSLAFLMVALWLNNSGKAATRTSS